MSAVSHLHRLVTRARPATSHAASTILRSTTSASSGGQAHAHAQRRRFMSNKARSDGKFYKVLGVKPDASQKEISSAYKKLAKQYHPDMSTGDADKFKEVSQAYEILSNDEKRQAYDNFGEEAAMGQGGGPGGPFGQNVDPFDLFSQVFGQQFGGGRQPGPRRTQDSRYHLKLSLEDLYHGAKRDITYNRDIICHSCDGVGGHNPQQCKKCGGSGFQVFQERMGPFVQQVQQVCSACQGQGYKIDGKDRCRTCHGKKIVSKKETFKVTIPPGEVQALCGFQFGVKHVSGEDLSICSQGGYVVRPNDLWKVDGKGMPRTRGSGFGDLIVEFDVEFPDKLPKAALEHLKKTLAEHVPSSRNITEVPEGQAKVFAFPTSASEKRAHHNHDQHSSNRVGSQASQI